MTQPFQATPANPPNQGVVEEYVATPTRHESQATQLAKMARDAEIEFFHAPDKTAYALLPVRGHFETVTIDGREMREWLAHRYFAQRQVVAGNAALKDAANTLAGIAVNDEPEVDVHLRLAEVGGRIYLDLADRDRRVIEIDSNGWRVAESPPVRFRRSRRMLPLPLPVPGGTPEQLWALLGVCGDKPPLGPKD